MSRLTSRVRVLVPISVGIASDPVLLQRSQISGSMSKSVDWFD